MKRKSNNQKRRRLIYSSADFLTNILKKKGIVVQRYNSKVSNSVYLKLDYGVLSTIRISDHVPNGEIIHKYNILTNFRESQITHNKNGFVGEKCYYFPIYKKDRLVNKVLSDRKEKINSYGEQGYKLYMDVKVADNYAETGYWQQGEII